MNYLLSTLRLSFIVLFLAPSICFAQYQTKASQVRIDASDFDGNLSASDNDVQKAMVTLDHLISGGGAQSPWTSNIDAAGYSLNQLGSLSLNSGNAVMFAGATDNNHQIKYDSDVNGLEFRGYAGFRWNTGDHGITNLMILNANGLSIKNNFVVSSSSQYDAANLVDYGQGLVGSYIYTGSAWNGNGFAFTNASGGTLMGGLVVNGDVMYFGEVSNSIPIFRIGLSDHTIYGYSNTLDDGAGNIEATSFKTNGGSSSNFVKGDGSLDSNTYQVSLGFTPENVTNKDTDGTLAANSDTKYASQKATKTYADTKVSSNGSITGATKTKITYDTKGLVTAGADATTSDIADSSNKRYVTDANLTIIGNTSGTNTGDETTSSIKSKLGITTLSGSNTGDQDLSGYVPTSRTVNGHALSSNVTVSSSDLSLGTSDSPTFTGLNLSGLTASQIIATDASKNLQSLAVATYPSLTELTYLKGVTSAIQTQLNTKGSGTITNIATSNGITGGAITTTGTISGVNAASDGSTKGVAAWNGTNFSCTTGVCNTIQDISTGSAPSFNGMTLTGNLTLSTKNIITDTSTGTKIGTTTSQKVGFFGQTPAVQQTGDIITGLQTLGLFSSTNYLGVQVLVVPTGATITLSDITGIDQIQQNNTESAGTLTVGAPGGTIHTAQRLLFRIKSSAIQTFSWNAIYRSTETATLPTATTGGSSYTYVGFVYNVTDTKWDCVLSNTIFQPSGNYITSLTGGVTASGPGAASATVVTNANLTGPITSVGNATSIASKTGTGTTFVVDTAPTIVTPTVTTSLTTSAANIITDTSTGTKIATATNQKIAFYNATPIVQPSGNVCTALQNLGLVASCTESGGGGTGTITAVGDVTSGDAATAAAPITYAYFKNATSGTVKLQTVAGALSSSVISLPIATDTLMGKATTDTMTNKTFDTAGSGNSFSINGVAASDNTGTGKVVRDTSPTIATAALGSSTATTQSQNDNSTKLATTAYVDSAILSQNYKEAVKYASIAVLPSIVYANGSSGVGATLTGVALAAISLDSSSPSVGDRVLIKNQASTFQNGIYTVTATGSGAAVFVLTRATDADQANEYKTGDAVFVTSGSTLTATTWAYTGVDSPTMGTDAITSVQIAGQGSFTGSNGVSISGTVISGVNAVADGSTKGVASFNSTNFSDNGSGIINTSQGISTAATPSFAGETLTGDLTLSTHNIITDTTTGTKLGTATTQKIGFYNATPIVQPGATTDLGVVLSNLGLRAVGTAYPITTSGSVTLGSLTSGRIPIASTAGLLADDADLTFLTDTLTATKIAATTFSGGFTMADAQDIVLNTSTGTKIGTATTQKLSFFNSTPIVQPGATTDLGTVLSNLGLRASGSAYPITTSGAITFTGGLTINTAGVTLTDQDIALGTTTGTKIGTATTQKLSFYNSTPIVKPSGDACTALQNLGLVSSCTVTATTNANLTGPITSSGNATSIASQTGTGTKFVVDTSPTLVTPVLGVATATSINKMAITAPATSSTIAVADGKTLTSSNTLTLAGTDSTTITFQATDTYVGRATTDTLTNKRITIRTSAVADATSISVNSDNFNAVTQTNTQTAGTLTVNNPTGTPTEEQVLTYRVKSTNIQTYSWGGNFAAGAVALPTASQAAKTDKILFIWDGTATKWECMAYGTY